MTNDNRQQAMVNQINSVTNVALRCAEVSKNEQRYMQLMAIEDRLFTILKRFIGRK